MNRVYKVIWNKGKNCYSVVSEMAKTHGKSSGYRKKAVTAVMVLSLLSAGGLTYAEPAANPAGTGPGIAIGEGSETLAKTGISIGKNAKTNHTNAETAIAIGHDAEASYGSIVIGNAAKDHDEAGEGATNSIIIGNDTKSLGDGTSRVILGSDSSAKGSQAMALGGAAEADGDKSITIGALSSAKGELATALGGQSKAAGENSTAIGGTANSQADYALALGGWSKGQVHAGVALGSWSVADREGFNEEKKGVFSDFDLNGKTLGAVSVGQEGFLRQIINVGDATEDTDAVNLRQLKAVQTEAAKHTTVAAGTNITVDEGTNDNGGKEYTVKLNDTLTGLKGVETEEITVGGKVTIDKDGLKTGDVTIKEDGIHAGDKVITGVADGVKATDAVNMRQLGALNNQVETNTTNISLLNGRVDVLGNRVNRVGAGAAALAGLHPLDYDSENKWNFAAGYGNYKGANAVAVGAFYRPDENKMISLGGSFGGGENMVSAGISVKVGQGTGISTSKAAMANEIRELKARDREREAQMQEIMRQLEILQKQAGK